MEIRSPGYNHRDHVAHRRDVNSEAEGAHEGLAIEKQICPCGCSRSLRIQVLAVRGPLRRSGHIRHDLSVHYKPITVSVIRIAYGQVVGVVITIWTQHHTLGAAGGAWLAIEHKPGKGLVAPASKAHVTCVKHMLVV